MMLNPIVQYTPGITHTGTVLTDGPSIQRHHSVQLNWGLKHYVTIQSLVKFQLASFLWKRR